MYHWVPQQCPICKVEPKIYLGRRGGAAHRQRLGVESKIWRCHRCSLTFPNPMPIPTGGPDQHYAIPPDEYFQHHGAEQKKLYVDMLLQQLRDLRMQGPGAALLDIGAGRGELLKAARLDGWETVGIETSSTFAEHAARHSGAEIRREPLEQCGFADGSFDAVILGAVLEHLYNPNEVIGEVARILRPGGVVFIDVPNEQGLYFRLGNLYLKMLGRNWVVNLAPTFPPFHVFGFGPKSLRALLAKHGLEPVIWYVFAGQSLVPSRGGLLGRLEPQAAKIITSLSKVGSLGSYIGTWARKISVKAG